MPLRRKNSRILGKISIVIKAHTHVPFHFEHFWMFLLSILDCFVISFLVKMAHRHCEAVGRGNPGFSNAVMDYFGFAS